MGQSEKPCAAETVDSRGIACPTFTVALAKVKDAQLSCWNNHSTCITRTSIRDSPRAAFTMPLLLRVNPRLFLRPIHRCQYSTASSPVINVTNVPAPHCGSIRILSLNRPAARNAISRQLLAELNHQVDSIHNEGETGATRALILASEVDSSFCAGADLKERAGFTPEE